MLNLTCWMSNKIMSLVLDVFGLQQLRVILSDFVLATFAFPLEAGFTFVEVLVTYGINSVK